MADSRAITIQVGAAVEPVISGPGASDIRETTVSGPDTITGTTELEKKWTASSEIEAVEALREI